MDGRIASIKPVENAEAGALRFHRHYPSTECTPRPHPVADVSTDIEGKSVRAHEAAVEAFHCPMLKRFCVVDRKSFENAVETPDRAQAVPSFIFSPIKSVVSGDDLVSAYPKHHGGWGLCPALHLDSLWPT